MLNIFAANAQWDDENRFDAILNDSLTHVVDEKPITTRQCIKALAQVGKAKPQHIPKIIDYMIYFRILWTFKPLSRPMSSA